MAIDLEAFVTLHRKKGILVDANLLLLLIIGTLDRNGIPDCDRTSSYTAEDYDVLKLVLSEFDRIIVTPNILTELSNLAGGLKQYRPRSFELLRDIFLPICDERYVSAAQASSDKLYVRFGLTDAGVSVLASAGVAVLTDDLTLYRQLAGGKLHAINFNHLRSIGW